MRRTQHDGCSGWETKGNFDGDEDGSSVLWAEELEWGGEGFESRVSCSQPHIMGYDIICREAQVVYMLQE